ncbi:sulfur carrier protein ThiS [bacterium BD-1]|uniref:sulfur carrier protein ThiS n=1 Tax=Arenimonas sp. TaxID=1872635 RepID=UPI001E3F1CE8|nr:sulfur carrier protein ThiS [Ottowia caeni]
MRILLNGEEHQVPAHATVADLLELSGHGGRKVAVEVNLEVVPRSQHGSRALAEGDRVEIIHAIGGG